ncbi:hypothetical protein GCM10009753_04140 [Streptantibioticus ferralitis]
MVAVDMGADHRVHVLRADACRGQLTVPPPNGMENELSGGVDARPSPATATTGDASNGTRPDSKTLLECQSEARPGSRELPVVLLVLSSRLAAGGSGRGRLLMGGDPPTVADHGRPGSESGMGTAHRPAGRLPTPRLALEK